MTYHSVLAVLGTFTFILILSSGHLLLAGTVLALMTYGATH